VPGTVLVGDTAAALHAGHRLGLDGDPGLDDPRERFDEVLATLEEFVGRKTAGASMPVLVLGGLDGVLTGIRQLRRTEPLETEVTWRAAMAALGEEVDWDAPVPPHDLGAV